MTDTITVLHSLGPKLVKTWKPDGTIDSYDEAKRFKPEVFTVANISDLSRLLLQLAAEPKACVIRGLLCSDAKLDADGPVFRRNEVFADQPLHALMIDVDSFVPVLKSADDTLGAIQEYIDTYLPAEFSIASYHWQLSNSAGHPSKAGKLNVHLWFWLAAPRTSAQIKTWAKSVSLKADHKVFQHVQIHYTGNPVMAPGVEDPVKVRSGFVVGMVGDEVEIDIPEVIAVERDGSAHELTAVTTEGLIALRDKVRKIRVEEKVEYDGQDYDKLRTVVFACHHESNGSDEGLAIAEEFEARFPGHGKGLGYVLSDIWPHAGKYQGQPVTVKSIDLILRNQMTPAERKAEQLEGFAELPAVKATPGQLPSFTRTEQGKVRPSIVNAIAALERPDVCNMRFCFDTFRSEIMVDESDTGEQWRPLKDVDYVRLREHFEKRLGFNPISQDMMRDAISLVADRLQFDSAIKWLNDIVPAWDGKPRIERFLPDYFGAEDTAYTRAVGLYWWTAHAARVLEPGYKVDMVPVLVGSQGVRKTTGVYAVAPAVEFVCEIKLDEMRDADLSRVLRGKVIAEIAELRGLRTRDAEAIKSFITRTHEEWIPKYKEHSVRFARRLVLVGTTNNEEFLEDDTGNRRWLPVHVKWVETDIIAADRLQLWAEGREVFKAKSLQFRDAEKLAGAEHSKFEVEDPWQETVERWLKGSDDMSPVENGRHRPARDAAPFTSTEVLTCALGLTGGSITQGHKNRLGKVLTRLGYKSKRSTGGKWMWVRRNG